jgi:hypothetical protein
MLSEPGPMSEYLLKWLNAPTDQFASPPVPPPLAPSARIGRCENERARRFTGDYSQIEIVGCQDVQLKDVRAAALRVRNSEVVMDNTEVSAAETALQVVDSQVELTACDLSGTVALDSKGSKVDLAGVTLHGRRAGVHISGSSAMVFSVCKVDSPVGHRYLHDEMDLNAGVDL